MSESISPIEESFREITELIDERKDNAVRAVNRELISLYWEIGRIISQKIDTSEWGEGVVGVLSAFVLKRHPGLKGFSKRNLYRMRQFFEIYPDSSIVSALLTQLPWTHNLTIMSQAKSPEEREFYLKVASRENWSSRELERQFKIGCFEQSVLNPPKVPAALTQIQWRSRPSSKTLITLNFWVFPTPTQKLIFIKGC